MASWRTQDAKARFSELLDTVLRKGPQIVTRRGVAEAVVVPLKEWERLQAARPSLKDLLLSPEPRFADLLPRRRRLKRRKPVELE